jgi:hypothetical protein
VLFVKAELEDIYAETKAAFAKVVEHFGENAAALSSEADFWNEISSFVHSFSNAQKEHLQVGASLRLLASCFSLVCAKACSS